jgi:short-subunit dehydrogenase
LKTVLVIGSNSDIATAAIELLKPNHHIVKIDRSVIDLSLDDSANKLEQFLDSTDPDIVVNCAGVFGNNRLDYDLVFNVNLKSNWTVINYYLRNIPTKQVNVVMLGSSTYKQGRKHFILYAASKSALHSVWQGASEFASENLKLGLINPVYVHTKMVASRPHPNPDICLTPDDVAQEIVKLCNMTQSQCIDMDYKQGV